MSYWIVFLGAGIGGACRHGVNQWVLRLLGSGFPFGTLIINIVGSCLMGLVAGYFALRGEAPQAVRLFLTTGILGGFTTFSAFSLDAALLYERGQFAAALGYAFGSVVLSILGLFLGLFVVRQIS
ncbi:fluoride efflux transporter CrcB [Prosthecodimorpha staleyi]|uniref:Fluoride-specific ion channel FluC n=1 Tax=Prosthecodimorpha staleyi TaxID=2840188 RepID=A0A947DB71_9HYPH|nr:fluoride efflux transporter CrcB [Prosthecodimorpha staleyi]MBT9292387.1 fluoride efflux transporter CrcB [Prosthecodimorpha staleyi]